MCVVSAVWKDCKRLIEAYNEQQVSYATTYCYYYCYCYCYYYYCLVSLSYFSQNTFYHQVLFSGVSLCVAAQKPKNY